MTNWHVASTVNEIPLNTKKAIMVADIALIIINLEGEFYAVQDICSHDGGILSNGWLEKEQLVCPRHGAHFCIKTGEALTPPAYEAIRTFPVKLAGKNILVAVE